MGTTLRNVVGAGAEKIVWNRPARCLSCPCSCSSWPMDSTRGHTQTIFRGVKEHQLAMELPPSQVTMEEEVNQVTMGFMELSGQSQSQSRCQTSLVRSSGRSRTSSTRW